MALQTFVGSFPAEVATGNKGYTGVGFQPKALIVFATLATAAGFVADAASSIGFASGSANANQRAAGHNSDDNVGTTDAARSWFDGVLGIPNTGGSARLWGARLVSFDSDGFTLNWTEVQATGIIVTYIALGGSDLSNVEVAEFALNTSTGNQAVSTSFQPDCVLLLSQAQSTGAAPLVGTTGAASLGAATSSSARWALSLSERDSQSMAANVTMKSYQRTDSCLLSMGGTGGERTRADFVSFDATPGFTINLIAAPVTADKSAYLALKGGRYSVGAFNKNTATPTGSNSITAPGWQPTGLLLASFNNAATTSITADSDCSVGFGDGTNERAGWSQTQDGVLNTEANGAISTTKAILLAQGPSTTQAEADHSMTANGFDLSWTTNDAVAQEVCYLAMTSNAVTQDTPELRGRPYGLRGQQQMSQLIAV